MKKHATRLRKTFTLAIFAAITLMASPSHAFVLTIVDGNGAPITAQFRWLLEEDTTVLTQPGVPVTDSISLVVHKSHAPVVTNGSSSVNPTTISVPSTNRYVISVLAEGYSVGGTTVAAGQTQVRVVLNKNPIPTTQITIVAFVDHDPINNIIDETDPRLGGCKVVISDVLGQVSQDAFGNPLGTKYKQDNNGTFVTDSNGDYVVEVMGTGKIMTLTQREFDSGNNPYNLKVGEAVVKFLPPCKYGIVVIPPEVDDNNVPLKWVQTTTIEGTPTIDAWVKANEPAYFVEGFGTGFKHVAHGFIKLSPLAPSLIHGQSIGALPWNTKWPAGGTARVEGTLRLNHFSKPPFLQGYFPGDIVNSGWIGLNDPNAQPEVTAGGLYAAPCDANDHFVISNLPAGQYQLVTWDKPLDTLFGVNAAIPANQATFTVTNGARINLGDVLCFRWFGLLQGRVFYDVDQDGFPDPGELGIPQQAVNLRFRNGVIYQSTLTRDDGSYELVEVFPFFKWLITEVDYARFKATGMTTVVDDGGSVAPDQGWAMPSDGVRHPQPQYQTDPVTGAVLRNAGGTPIPVNNPNTGNNFSRTETGPVLLQAQHLFLNQNNRIDWGKVNYPSNENGGISGIAFYSTTRAEEDPRYAAGDRWEPGIPRVQFALYSDLNADKIIDDLNGNGVTIADVDNYPLGWATGGPKGREDVDRNQNGRFDPGDAIQIVWSDSWDDTPPTGSIQTNPPVVHGKPIIGCDNFSTWNQVRPGVFDGGYFFGSYYPGGMAGGSEPVEGLPPGMYIVQSFPPPGYLIQTEESLNVVMGDTYQPSPLMIAPECVGTTNNGAPLHVVPPYLTLFPGKNIPAPFAGQMRPLADRKWIKVSSGQNAAADYHMYTEVPKAARAVGFVNNDLGAEFNQSSPNFGEKLAAPWIPISVRDWNGTEIQRIYTDEYGGYNALLPSTYNVNVPTPSGVSENMITFVLNDPLKPDGTIDPFYNPMYSTTPWTFNFTPGGVTYLDTPLVPLAAFSTAEKRIDTEPVDHTPAIKTVNGPGGTGPWVCYGSTNRQITITAMGPTPVINPNYDSNIPGSPMNIVRDYGFGNTQGKVTLCGVNLAIVSWTTNQIVALLPTNTPTGELLVTRKDNNKTTPIGITFHAVDCSRTAVHHVPAEFPTIQSAIDSPETKAGDLILVAPGIYNENVILNKPVKLQGYGAGSTIIYGNPTPLERLQTWHDRVNALGGADFATFLMKDPFQENEAPVVLVCGELVYPAGTLQIAQGGTKTFNPGYPFTKPGQAQLDGFQLLGSKAGGGIFVVCGASYFKISNLDIRGNQGGYSGAIAVGTQDSGFDSQNRNLLIQRTYCHRNSGIQGGGAISMNEYSDNYVVENNTLIGNFTRFNGAGFNHRGFSGGTNILSRNTILFNENGYAALLNLAGEGGGVYIGGDVAGGTGAGNVIIDGNLIQGNLTGAGSGGGISVFALNGLDVINAPGNSNAWFEIQILNNVIVNNIAAAYAGGIMLQDVARTTIAHNTVANNDCTATSRLLFSPGTSNSLPQPAGIVVRAHGTALATALGRSFTSPRLRNNIIWHNRSFYNNGALNGGAGGLLPNSTQPYWDLAIVGTTGQLDVRNCLLTTTNGYSGNISGNPQFVQSYTNSLQSATVIDEGGNNINVRFQPITLTGDYHIQSFSPAVSAGTTNGMGDFAALQSDFDGQFRPNGASSDIGADEYGPILVASFNELYSVVENSALEIPARGVLANDLGVDTLVAVLVRPPVHGTLVLNRDGGFLYRPNTNFTGVDSFTYRPWGWVDAGLVATATILVRSGTLTPITEADNYTVGGNTSLTIPAPGVLGNDIDLEGDALTATIFLNPLNGTLNFNPNGSFVYTPNVGFVGTDLFLYEASDGVTSSGWEFVFLEVITPQPDFVVTAIGLNPSAVKTGTEFSASVTVQNIGGAAGPGGRLAVWVNQPGLNVPPGTPGDAFVDLGTIPINATTNVTIAGLIGPALAPPEENQQAPVIFRAYVNAIGTQNEFPKTNNQMIKQYVVTSYDAASQGLPVDKDGIDADGDGNPTNDVAYMLLAASDGFARMGDGTDLYTFGFSDHTAMAVEMAQTHPELVRSHVMMHGMLKGEASSPTIVLKEGQEFYLDLSNVGMMIRPDLFDPHTVHFHGFPQAASIFDGEPMGSIAINMGGTLRYYYKIVEPGTYLYHCHVEATEHMQMGMIGNLYVLPKQNNLPDGATLNGFTHRAGNKYAYNDGDGSTRYDVEYPLQLTGFDRKFHQLHERVQPLPFADLFDDYPLLNGRGYPDTIVPGPILNSNGDPSQKVSSLITATKGQRILLRLSNVSVADFHTLTVLGIPMKVIGKDARLLRGPTGKDLSYKTTSVTLGGGESADVMLETSSLNPGTYFVYAARLNHLCNDQEDYGGVMTEIIIQP